MSTDSAGQQDALPVTVLVPEDASASIEVYDQHAALKIAVVEREGAHLLSDEWDVPGVYILLDRPDHDGTWGVYAGKAPSGVRTRLRDHLRNKDHWTRAVLVRRDTTFGFNSAQVGWLEGRLYDMFDVAEYAVLHNGNRPSDETLPPYDRQMLELVVLPVRRVLGLIGHDPRTPDDSPPVAASATKKHYGTKLPELVEAGLLDPGARLTSTNGAWPATATVTATGEIEYAGTSYASPSTAASAAKGGLSANGWEFWAVDTGAGKVSLAVLRERHHDAAEPGTA